MISNYTPDMPREEREAVYKDIFKVSGTKGYQASFRALCRGDLYFLLAFALNRSDVRRDFLYARCMEVQENPDGYLDVWAREFYKSTIITFAKTIQDILIDPEETVGIFSHTRPIAKAFLRQIQSEFENNTTLKEGFPDILWENPRKEAPSWSLDGGIQVKRLHNPKEATVEAWGLVDGQPTGRHFKLMVFDDVVTKESVYTPEMIKKTMDAVELSYNLGAAGGRRRVIGTRYHYNDAYATMKDRGSVIERRYPATSDGTVHGDPIFLSAEILAEKRRDMGNATYSAQMLQDPAADNIQGFDVEWLEYWAADNFQTLNTYVLCDPASSKKKSGDYTVFWVVGVGADRNYYLIDLVRDRLTLTERADALFRLHQKYRPLGVGYEKYGLQSDIEHFNDRMQRENYRFKIIELGGNIPKVERIMALEPLFRSGRVFLPKKIFYTDYEGKTENLIDVFIKNEYRAFPFVSHDDMLDGLARVLDSDMKISFPRAVSAPHLSLVPPVEASY